MRPSSYCKNKFNKIEEVKKESSFRCTTTSSELRDYKQVAVNIHNKV